MSTTPQTMITHPRTDIVLLRFAISFVWLFTGLAVLHPHYQKLGSEFLRPTGFPDWVMFATCAFEVLLGLRVLFGRASTWLVLLQIAMISTFTLILTVTSTELLANGFGMLSKNVTLIFLLGAQWHLEREGMTMRCHRLILIGLAFVWIWEGLVPCVLVPYPELQVMLSNLHLDFGNPKLALRILGVGEVIAGLALLFLRGRTLLGLLICQMLGLMGIIAFASWHDPRLWVHPFGPITKNVPLLVGTVLAIRPLISSSPSAADPDKA